MSESTPHHDGNNDIHEHITTNAELERAPTQEPEPYRVDDGAKLVKTETSGSLRNLGVKPEPPIPDVNYPAIREREPFFPEEYTMETQTGIVPEEALELVRSRTRQTIPEVSEEEKKLGRKKTADFVTFTFNDPDNPHNWNRLYRWYITIVVSMLVVCVAFGSANVTGGLGLIEERYHVSQEVATLTCSIMVMGFAVGPLIWSPLSELIGRRPVYIISLTVYTIMNIPCALSPNIGGLLASRFVCGVFASSGLTIAGGTIADIWAVDERGMAIAYFAAAPYGGPVVGPIVCGWINIGTRRLKLFFWVTLAFTGFITVLVGLIPETYAPVILKQRAKNLRKKTGNENIMTEQEMNKPTLKEIIKTCLLRPLGMIATEPILVLMCVYVTLIYAMLYLFFFAYPVIFGELYGYNDGIIGLMFIPILIGVAFALLVTPETEKAFTKICAKRSPTPEDRLLGAMIGAPFVPIALFILGATAFKHIIWVGPASAGIAFGFGMVLVYYSINNYIIDSYQEFAASALAAKVFIRSGGGAASPLFTTQMYHGLGLQWASWLLAFVSLAMVLIPYGFYFYGAKARAYFDRKRAFKEAAD